MKNDRRYREEGKGTLDDGVYAQGKLPSDSGV